MTALTRGNREAARPLRKNISNNFGALIGALRDDRKGSRAPVATAITLGISQVEKDPTGQVSAVGREGWDGLAFGGYTLRCALDLIGHNHPFADDDWLGKLPLARRFALVLVEVERMRESDVAQLFHVTTDRVEHHHQEARLDLDLAPLPDSNCPTWPMAARVTSLYGTQLDDAEAHLATCNACRTAHLLREERRERLQRKSPSIAWTGLGRAWFRAPEFR